MSHTKRSRIAAPSKVGEFLMDTVCAVCRVSLFEDRSLVTCRSDSCVKGCHALCALCVFKLKEREGEYFNCPICRKKGFGTQDVLSSHMKVQMEGFAKEADFFCKDCETGFKGDEAYEAHLKCPTCGFTQPCGDDHSCTDRFKQEIAMVKERHRMKEKMAEKYHRQEICRLEEKYDDLLRHCQDEHGCDHDFD